VRAITLRVRCAMLAPSTMHRWARNDRDRENANRAFLHFFRIFLRLYAAIHVHGLIERLLLLAEERWRGSFQKPVKVMCRVWCGVEKKGLVSSRVDDRRYLAK